MPLVASIMFDVDLDINRFHLCCRGYQFAPHRSLYEQHICHIVCARWNHLRGEKEGEEVSRIIHRLNVLQCWLVWIIIFRTDITETKNCQNSRYAIFVCIWSLQIKCYSQIISHLCLIIFNLNSFEIAARKKLIRNIPSVEWNSQWFFNSTNSWMTIMFYRFVLEFFLSF